MSKKTKGKNAFYFFMLDWKKREEAGGRVFPEGLKDVQRDSKCSEEWQNLSSQEKGYYNKRAKDSKIETQGSLTKKTALGESVEEVAAADKREQEYHQNMLQYIESIITMSTKHKNLEKLKFMVIHVNWFFTRVIGINKYDYCPAEFAVGEFSLENGIENIYHEIINSKIPLGWKRDAIEISQQTHRIPVELSQGKNDFLLMYNKLIALLKNNQTGNKLPPLFTSKGLVPAVKSLLTKMTHAAGVSSDDFLIYSLEALFGSLRNTATQSVDDCTIPLVVAENEFGKDTFLSVCNLECDFHKCIDGSSQYCSMSIIKRWGFTICDYCCEFLGVPMVEGVHFPVAQTIDYVYQEVAEQEGIDTQLQLISLSDQPKLIEWNGVTEEHRRKVSERSYAEELRRRNESKRVDVIDHSKLNAPSNNAILTGRPLRLPKTTSLAINEIKENINCLNVTDFPPLGGEAKTPKKDVKNIKLPLGRGRCRT
ncbi:protein maelstrom homolog [Osmia bicornis bicornis]|uniref:protein maelstrom homolog n=1 Tax=Osmia bicornis bicornis TaxID=1437191 RepID=UPI001EAECE54|nr:protein maelstrom homolog [Osmia bicornis bicornis]